MVVDSTPAIPARKMIARIGSWRAWTASFESSRRAVKTAVGLWKIGEGAQPPLTLPGGCAARRPRSRRSVLSAPCRAARSSLSSRKPEPLVHEWRLRYDNADLGIPAHVTLLFPFVPAEEIGEELVDELRDLFAGQPAFSFSRASRDSRTSPGSRPTPPIRFAA